MRRAAGYDTVLVVDFGAQYAQLIARRVRSEHVYSEIVPAWTTAAEMLARNPRGVILSGGPKSVNEPSAPSIDPELFVSGVPVLGICYGAQLLAQLLGGRVARTGTGEFGRTELLTRSASVLMDRWDQPTQVWMSHADSIVSAPEGFTVTGATATVAVAAFEDRARDLYGVQFHPEVVHTERGQDLLRRFLFEVCGCRPSWTHASVIASQVDAVHAQVGSGHVLCALSGGVDSAVAAALVDRAVGDQLTAVFIDTGLMRAGEGDQVEATFLKQFAMELVHVKAAERFFRALAGLTDPEQKRKVIGQLFIRLFEEVALERKDARYLVQGTLYPDVIESGTAEAAMIKSHHNVGGLPEEMNLDLVEPLRLLFKDEVRSIGEELGLPAEIVWRQPFPGPGLAVRVVGEVTPDRVEILRAADEIVLEEIRRDGLDTQLWQWFAVLPVVRSVGVMGDERTYGYPIVVRAVTSEDAMTADWARLPHGVLERISSRVINEVRGVNRVLYDVTSKPPGTIEWE